MTKSDKRILTLIAIAGAVLLGIVIFTLKGLEEPKWEAMLTRAGNQEYHEHLANAEQSRIDRREASCTSGCTSHEGLRQVIKLSGTLYLCQCKDLTEFHENP